MDLTNCYLFLLLLTSLSGAERNSSNGSSIEDYRVPRVTGRIVKVYSGPRPEPYLCSSEGFKADPQSCASFYRCVREKNGKFNVFRYQCAPGTVFDPDLDTCNHPRSTRRTECGGVIRISDSIDSTLANEIDSSQKELPRPIITNGLAFTKDTNSIETTGTPWLTSQRITSMSNSHLETTQHSPSSGTHTSNKKYNYDMSTNLPWSAKEEYYQSKPTSQSKVTSKNGEICSSNGFAGDTENCRKFYRCVGSKRGGFLQYEFFCSESTVWDEEIQSCNHPWAVKRSKCGRSMSITVINRVSEPPRLFSGMRSNKEQTTTSTQSITAEVYGEKIMKTSQHQLQVSHGSKVSQTQTQISHSDQVIQNQTQINYGERLTQNVLDSKQNQTQVSPGSAISQTQTQIDYGHKGMQTQLQIDHTKDSSQSQTQIHESTTLHATTKQTMNKNEHCSQSGFMGDSNDCKKFYRCVDSGRGTFTKYEYLCGDGTVWDQSIEACNHAWAVKQCGHSHTDTHIPSTEKYTTSYTETITSTQSPILITSDATDIDDIDVGYGNQGSSDTTTHSSLTTKTTTENPKHESPECSSTGFMGDSNDCKKFYRCVDSGRGSFTRYEFKCGEGTLWDSNIEACNHNWAVKRCGGASNNSDKNEVTTQKENTVPTFAVQTTVTLLQSTTQFPTSIDDYDNGYGSQNQESPSKSTVEPSKEPNNAFNSSECQSSGFMGDANSCKIFYRCVDNGKGGYARHVFTCGEGTVWDPTIDACNHAWAVKKCGGSDTTGNTSQTTEPNTTATSGETTTTTGKPTHTTSYTSTMISTESFDNNECNHSGFMEDKRNCKRFYRCVDNGDGTYARYEFTCGEGTVWDSNIEACNHEWAVKSCGGSSEYTTPIHSSTLQHSTMQDELEDNSQTTLSYVSSTSSQKPTTTIDNDISTSTTNTGCTGSGYVGDSNNCKKFYRCVDNGNGGYDRYEFTCGDGTVWDDSISSCNHEWAVKKCGASETSAPPSTGDSISEGTVSSTDTENKQPTQPTTEKSSSTTGNPTENEIRDGDCIQEGFFGSLIDCKKFYRCVDDGKGSLTKYEFNCGEGTTWNPEIGTCDHPSPDRQCGQNYQSTTKESHIHDEMGTESTTKLTLSTTSSQKDNGTCDSEGFFGNPIDCKKFYRCVDDGKDGYTKYDFSCGAGTVWNQEILACDHESDDKSCLSTETKPTESSHSDAEGTTSRPQPQSTISSTTIANNQVTDKIESPESVGDKCTSEGFFSHPHDCKKFVRCVSNGNGGYTKYEFSCGEGTLWVQEIQACDHDDGETNCGKPNELTTKQPDHENSVTTQAGLSTENHTNNKVDDEYPTTKEPSSIGSDKCTAEGYFGNRNDCRKFYRCVDNGNGQFTKYDFACGEGTAWDTNTGTCNHIKDVASCTENQKEESNTQTTNSESTSQTTERSSSTTKETASSESSEESGPKPGSHEKCKSEGYHGNSDDCKKFYRCVDDGKGGLIKYDFTCADGTIWDKDITNCNHPQDVTNPSCESKGDNNQSAESSSSPSTSSISENSTQSSSNCSGDSSEKPANSKDVSCEHAGYYPNPNDCKKFYRCVDWDGNGKRFSVYHFDCGEGTIWDPALDTCNHEESVYPPRDCSQTQSQTESLSTEGTTAKQEETTSQESTSSEQTTTQENTTSEQTTTEKEKTTTQQSTTSELSTSQQSTTSEQTTTQESTTSEQTTTQESTTNKQTTTQEPTTSQQSTTNEQTTQESTTTEQTNQESTTNKQTTQEYTTSQQTTQESTTTEQTTEGSTTNEQTTEQSTTQENNQTETSTTESTTESSTTEDNSSTTEQSSTTESEHESTTASSSSENKCPETDNDQYLFACPTSFKRHPKYCNMFYQCTEDDDTHEAKIATFKCPNNTIYDESKTQCVEEKKADEMCNGEIARQYRFKRLYTDSMEPITVDEDKKSCPSVGYFAFEKNIECSNGFLKCERSKLGKLRGYVNQCPEGYLFWTISKRCELAVNIRDCKRSSNNWKGRWNIPVDRRNVA